jgi:hypothetical protein
MSTSQIRLEPVRRKSGGRIHLTPRVPRSGPVETLCGQTLDAGSYVPSQDDADCVNCVRRSKDQSRVSGAFFAQDAGTELLRLSLEQARRDRPAGAGPPHPGQKPLLRVISAPKPKLVPLPERVGELVTRGFRRAAEGVWRSPDGVLVRMKLAGGRWRFDELVFEGAVVATRTRDGVRIRAGDVEVAPSGSGCEVSIRNS